MRKSTTSTDLFRNRVPGFPALLALTLLLCGETLAESIPTIGWIEDLLVTEQNLKMPAKIDTGADNSSLHAVDVKLYKDNGREWVDFVLIATDGTKHSFRKPLLRMTKIKKKISGHVVRPVVMLDVCIGNQNHSIEVNLAQRSEYRYPMLLGRSVLGGRYLVDSGKKYLQPPTCLQSRPAPK